MYSEYDKSAAFGAWQMRAQSASVIDTQRSFVLVPFGLTAIFPSPTGLNRCVFTHRAYDA